MQNKRIWPDTPHEKDYEIALMGEHVLNRKEKQNRVNVFYRWLSSPLKVKQSVNERVTARRQSTWMARNKQLFLQWNIYHFFNINFNNLERNVTGKKMCFMAWKSVITNV